MSQKNSDPLEATEKTAAEAIATLEALEKQGSQTTAIYRTLGDLYLEVGLNPLAESRYMRATQLAAEAGDVEE